MLSDYDRKNIGAIIADGEPGPDMEPVRTTWFNARLLRLIHHADAKNLARLRLAFPDVVQAYQEWKRGD